MAERTFIRFTFLQIDPAWQRRADEQGAEDNRAMPVGGGGPAFARPPRACSAACPATSRPEPTA
ncbi:MAG: hypothetical protein R2691_10800 [Solirubrobacterales bacterium]